MKVATLLYHDVVDKGQYHLSGFQGPGANRYKLEVNEFKKHLEAIARTREDKPKSVFDLLDGEDAGGVFLITFDDGGESAYTKIVDILEGFGWRGHFLIATDYIGTPGFVGDRQIKEIKERGHVVGSHSCTHPKRISRCNWEELVDEWRASVSVLSDILGEQVVVASVPGGYYSKKVAEAASFAGIKALFSSEPTVECHYVDKCLVLGRYMVTRDMTPEIASALVRAQSFYQIKQSLLWNSKKIVKSLGGRFYLKMRELYLGQK